MLSVSRLFLIWMTVFLGLAVLKGCSGGNSLVEVTRTVSYQGEPVSEANVLFQPASGPPAMGQTDAQGNFSLSSSTGRGASPGPAKVAITAHEEIASVPPSEEDPEGYSEVRSLIPEQYGTMVSTPLEVEITVSGENHFDFELTD